MGIRVFVCLCDSRCYRKPGGGGHLYPRALLFFCSETSWSCGLRIRRVSSFSGNIFDEVPPRHSSLSHPGQRTLQHTSKYKYNSMENCACFCRCVCSLRVILHRPIETSGEGVLQGSIYCTHARSFGPLLSLSPPSAVHSQDAHNLAWKLAAVHHGLGSPDLLMTYEEGVILLTLGVLWCIVLLSEPVYGVLSPRVMSPIAERHANEPSFLPFPYGERD